MAFTHVTVGTNDIDTARQFYDRVLGTLGLVRIADQGDTDLPRDFSSTLD